MVNFYFSMVGNGECAGIGDSYILSVRPVIVFGPASVTSRHLANYNDTHVLFGTH